MQEESSNGDFTIAVSFRHNAKAYEFRCNHLRLKVGDPCVVDTERGPNIGVVTRARIKAPGRRHVGRIKNVIRKATRRDLKLDNRNRELEGRIYRLARRKIEEQELKMKVSHVEVTFEEMRAIIYYTSEGRIDFRDMVKGISSELDVRIEMRKLGIRDEAKMQGGCGICGHALCCTTFLHEFAPVSIRMAKDQNLSLNNSKISGVCGRLMCCLVYENDFYREMQKTVPRLGRSVMTPRGRGRVIIADYLRERVTVELQEGGREVFDAKEVSIPEPQQAQKKPKKRPEGNGSSRKRRGNGPESAKPGAPPTEGGGN